MRDAYPKQLGIGSVLLKQQSKFKEFWYYDIEDGKHMIQWKDFKHLSVLIKNLTKFEDVERLRDIGRNGRDFVDNYLNDDCVDCFIVHMIQLYNYYFFDETSVIKESNDILINRDTIIKHMNKGYKSHIYNYKYYCEANGEYITSQKYTNQSYLPCSEYYCQCNDNGQCAIDH